jgi:hypothetical protein
MIVACSSKNIVLVKTLLDGGIIGACPYTIGFIDACLLAGEYFLLVAYFGNDIGEVVLKHLEQEERYEDCAALKTALESDCTEYFL